MSDWEPFDIKPSKGKYAWKNKRNALRHIKNKLDRLLFHNNILTQDFDLKFKTITLAISYHKPIPLTMAIPLSYLINCD